MKRGIVFAAAVAFQVAILVGMIAMKYTTLAYGRTVLLETVPVDPRSLFSGDYVILGYPFSTVTPLKPLNGKDTFPDSGVIYVLLQQDGRFWRAKGYQRDWGQPSGKDEVLIRGEVRGSRVEYGIESYYVPEGKGREIEEAIRRRWDPKRGLREEQKSRVEVEVSVGWRGQAIVKRVFLDGKELPY